MEQTMSLNEFIQQQLAQLQAGGQYKEVFVNRAEEITIERAGEGYLIGQDYMSPLADRNQNVRVVHWGDLEPKQKYQGALVKFDVRRPRKRKLESADFYVVFLDEAGQLVVASEPADL